MTTMHRITLGIVLHLYHTYLLLYSNGHSKMTSYYVTINLETKDKQDNNMVLHHVKNYTKILYLLWFSILRRVSRGLVYYYLIDNVFKL